MISNLIKSLDKFWEVENRPKQDLSRCPDEYFLDVRKSNLIVIVSVISIFTITVVFIGGGML